VTLGISSRQHSIEVFKLVAIFGVILLHLAPNTASAERLMSIFQLFAVPYFYTISLYFFVEKLACMPTFQFSALKLDRLYIPYLCWTIVYVLMRLVKARIASAPFNLDLASIFLFGGAAVHLYFIPMLLFFQSLLIFVFFVLKPRKIPFWPVVISLASIAYLYYGIIVQRWSLGTILPQASLYIISGYLLYVMRSSEFGLVVRRTIGFLFLPFLLTIALAPDTVKPLAPLSHPIAGLFLSAFALSISEQIHSRFILIVASASYGIYLSHFAFIEVIEFLADRMGFVLAPYSVLGNLLVGSVVASFSVLFVVIVRKSKFLSCCLLGERQSNRSP
jgi:hypothetical protein